MTQILTQEERIKLYGIECSGPSGDGILFKASTWRPGGEYIQKLIVKNVSSKVKKFKYKLPSTRYFSLGYPEEIILSPGIHKEIDVVFRPVEYEPYDDTIYIKILDGVAGHGFHVPVRATIDKLILSAPEFLDLGFCTTHQITTLNFMLTNDGEVDAPFQWDSPAPFRLDPASGTIPVGGREQITITIMPEDASVYAATAVCHVGAGVHAIIPEPIIRTKLSAKSKYAHINVSEGEVNFGEVVSGMSAATKLLKLRNTTVVPAEFTLVRFDQDRDEVFGIYPKAGIVPPMGEIDVTVSYTALAMGCFSLDRYSFRTPGGCDAVLTCRALAVPPKITLCKEAVTRVPKFGEIETDEGTMVINGQKFREAAPEFSLNFRDVEVGKVETRIFYLRNDSNRDAPFCIVADEGGTFQMTPKMGIIPALFKQYPVKVVFTPPKPINFYRRFFVLVGDSMPLFYDCLGTGYIRARGEIREQRPAPLRHAHVQAYRNRSVQGLGGLSPDELDRLYDETEPSPYFAHAGKIGTRALSIATVQRPVTRTGESVRTLVAPAHEFFISDTDMTSRDVIISRTTMDFGFTPHGRSSLAKTLTMTNNTHSKVVVEWQIPVANGLSATEIGVWMAALTNDRDKDVISADRVERERAVLQAFTVSPLSCDINPGQSATFEITFMPKQSNRNYTNELEAFVFFKNQRTFRLVNDHSLTPPFCVTVTNVGHTFATGQLLAKAQLLGGCIKGGKLVFPCVFAGEITYQTVMLRNTSNLPCTYQVELGWDGQDKGDEIFSVKPAVGEIAAEGFTLVCVRFAPTATRKYIQLLRLYVNGDEGGKLLLEGAGAVPYLTLPDLLTPTSAGMIHETDALDGQTLSAIQQREAIWGVAAHAPAVIPKGPMGTFYLKPTCVGLSNCRPFQLKNATRLPLRYKATLSGNAAGVAMVTPKTGIMQGNELTSLSISFAPRRADLYEFTLTISVYPVGGRTQPVKDANQPGPEAAPELLQTMTVRVVGQGETSALVFDPCRTTAEVRLVNTFEERAIFLDNFSDSDLSYQLLYKEEFEPDAASLDSVRTISEIMPLAPHSQYGALDAPSVATTSVGSPAKKFEHSLFCEKPQGILPARSRTRVLFTYQPRKAGLFEFLIYAQVQAVDAATLQPIMISNDEAALLRLAQEDRESGNLSPVAPMASTLAMLPLMSNITARAAFPKLLFEDIRPELDLQIADVDALWKRFNLSALNYDLSIPMTPREVLLNEGSAANLTDLMNYKFEFMPAVLGSPLQTIVLQLRNNGYLTTEFHAHLPNEKKLELEAWCDEEEPSEELNRLICIIEELRLFTITPQHAVLQPGETCTLTVSYAHTSLKYQGQHNLPVLVQLSQGKQFYLDLTGRTLPQPHNHAVSPQRPLPGSKPATALSHHSLHSAASHPGSASSAVHSRSGAGTAAASNGAAAREVAQYAHLPDFLLVVNAEQGNLVRLSPVPIGLNATLAPLQRIELINVSAVVVNYDVENQSLDELIEQNFHCPIVRVVNPTGTVPPQGSVYLELHFYPLESKTYEFPLKIKYTGSPALEKAFSSFDVGDGLPTGVSSAQGRKHGGGGTAQSVRSRADLRSGGPFSPVGGSSVAASAAAAAALATAPQYLDLQIQVPGYDPRDAKPVRVESHYPGGLPPKCPLLTLPAQKLALSEDLLDFRVVPQLCSARRITVLRNTSTTAAYEFVVDESSCNLCVDGLLSVRPLFGKLEPQDSVVLEFTFAAYAQSMAFNERIKLMVRELIKGAQNKKSGMREALLKKIANKKTAAVEHDSVVARPTFARTVQLDHAHLPGGLQATLPSTVNAKGSVVSRVVHPAFRNRDGGDNQHGATTGGIAEVTGSFMQGEVGEVSSPSTHSRTGRPQPPPMNRIVEIDVPGQSQRSVAGGGGKVGSPNSAAGFNRSQFSASGEIRTGLSSRGEHSITSDSKRSGANGGPATLLGPPSVLIVRLVGDVYPIETTKSLLERNKDLQVLSEFVVPENPAFIPPVGQKFFDPAFANAQKALRSKGKVNLSLIRDRDGELRGITEIVADALFRDVLNADSTREYTRATLAGINVRAIDIPGSSHGRTQLPGNAAQADANRLSLIVSYGVYFHEILPQPPLLERLVVELKHCGILPQPAVPSFLIPQAATTAAGPQQVTEADAEVEETVRPFTGTSEPPAPSQPPVSLPPLPLPLTELHNPLARLTAAYKQAEDNFAQLPVLMQWVTAGDALLAANATDAAVPLRYVPEVLNTLGIWDGSGDATIQETYDAVMACAEESSCVVAVNSAAGASAHALLSRLDSAATYSFRSVSTASSGTLTRAASMAGGTVREVNLAVLLKRLPASARAFVEKGVCRLADSRRRGGGAGVRAPLGPERMDTATSLESMEGAGDAPEVAAAVGGLDGGSQLTLETIDPGPAGAAEDNANPSAAQNIAQPATDKTDSIAKTLLKSKTGFATLASEVLSSVFVEIMQDTLIERQCA